MRRTTKQWLRNGHWGIKRKLEKFSMSRRDISGTFHILYLSTIVTWSTVHRCLAHIINLATQALIATRSKAKYYNPHDLEDPEDEWVDIERDEVGLVRKICVKVGHYIPSSILVITWFFYRLVRHHNGRRSSSRYRKTRTFLPSNCCSTWRYDGGRHT